MIINCYQPYWNSGLVVWFSTCVQEEPVSILGCPHVQIIQLIFGNNSIFARLLQFF